MITLPTPLPLDTSAKKPTQLNRIQSIDFLRGIIMIIMAIDHVRVYSGIPAGGLTAGIFFTRWITHYCAPGFAFFAGTSAFLYFQRSGDRKDLVKFLVTRGILLVILEITVVRFFWTFNFDYKSFNITGVIWMLGWCMIFLAAFVKLRPVVIAVIGITMIAVQQVFAFVPDIFPSSLQGSVRTFWGFFYPSGEPGVTIGAGSAGLPSAFGLDIFYVLIPWIGVMMAGYGFGQVLLRKPAERNKICLRIGISATFLFLVAGTLFILTDKHGSDAPFVIKLLGQQKYPPTQFYILMTLGPLIALIPWAEKAKGWLSDAVITIGRVPMFYYLLHLLLLHLSAFVVNLMLYGSIQQQWYETAPFVGIPEEQRWGLPILYVVWIIDVVILYAGCRWYATYKFNNPGKIWVRYL
jgi:uncharacterized membrane protein